MQDQILALINSKKHNLEIMKHYIRDYCIEAEALGSLLDLAEVMKEVAKLRGNIEATESFVKELERLVEVR